MMNGNFFCIDTVSYFIVRAIVCHAGYIYGFTQEFTYKVLWKLQNKVGT